MLRRKAISDIFRYLKSVGELDVRSSSRISNPPNRSSFSHFARSQPTFQETSANLFQTGERCFLWSSEVRWVLGVENVRHFSAAGSGASGRWRRMLARRESRADSKKKSYQLKQRPVNEIQPVETNASLAQISSVVNHNALIITRDIEWGTVLLGFEQANKYTVLDQNGSPVALIAEDITGIGNAIGRQVLRTRRSFTATVFSADGSQVIFKIRRPMYLINSSMFVEDGEGNVLGEIQQRWHLLKRNYDLYMDKKQYAQITGNFLAWEFELKDENGGTLALIDRNFQGFGKELFTDAGKYVVHFGESAQAAAEHVTATLKARTNNPQLPPVTPLAKLRTGVDVIPTYTGNQLVVARKLELSERMIALACAMTIDYDYFSTHSHGSGLFAPPLFIPMPIPGGGAGGVEGGEAGSEAAAAGATPTGSESGTEPGTTQQSTGAEGDLGGDEFGGDSASMDGEWLDSGEGDDGDWFGSGGGDGDGEGGGGLGELFGNISDILSGGGE